ncbi:MAG: peptidase S10 [Candidatus Eremiobacteraeota bacterium]|nr:peptidase S10 [Candidatus Eremiobacteraeota bacterium]
MGAAAQAAPAPSPSPTPAAPAAAEADAGGTPDAVTQHTIAVSGRTIAYTARAGTIALYDKKEQPTARVFYTAFTEDLVAASTRPVTFIYNGGPGSSTMWLRMGSIGPVRVLATNGTSSGPPPYRVVDNPYTLLDKSDLVFIDMPDSGFGRIVAGKEKEYFGVDQDIAAFGQFITRYVSRFDRWNSPKFLFGESYGTTRSSGLSYWLLNHGVGLNGVILLSSYLNAGLENNYGAPIGGGDWGYALYLPTEAATAWYHHRVANAPADLPTYLNEVKQFALGEYLDALYRGDTLSPAARDDVIRKLSRYTGLPQQFIKNGGIRVSYDRFQRELLRSQGRVVGRLDGRFTTYATDRSTLEGPQWDPTDSAIDSAYTAAVNQYIRQTLKYNPNINYRGQIYDIIYADGSSWDNSHNGRYPMNVAPDLAEAMTQNPNLKVFSANGYYDFATPFFETYYVLTHLNVAPAIESNISYGYYESGHMVYLNDSVIGQFKADLARWYDSATAR